MNMRVAHYIFTVPMLATVVFSTGVSANSNTSGEPVDQVISTENVSTLEAPGSRTLTDPNQLSPTLQELYKDMFEEAVGTGGHPFTTKKATGLETDKPVKQFPWRATGKLHMAKDGSRFVCTASVIGKNLLVTAAHCVHEFGKGREGFVESVSFEPARYELARPFGTWTAKQWWIPSAYFDGTDVCTTGAPGVVCENDVAVVVLRENEGQAIADLTGMYEVNDGTVDGDAIPGYGFVKFLGKTANQITQLGYPSRNYDGDKMIRTDSLGFLDMPNNVIIGSSQTGGSSGGPWLANFGVKTSFSGNPAQFNDANQVVAVTSWGFTNDMVKIQGASMFGMNTTYTVKSNIRSLVDSACGANPGAC